MSWDISVLDLPADAHSESDIPHDFASATLGERSELIATILDVAPQSDFSHPAWGELSTSPSRSSSTWAEMPSSTP